MTGSPWWRLCVLAVGAVVTWAALRALRSAARPQAWRRVNYRGRPVSLVGGVVAVVTVTIGSAEKAVLTPGWLDGRLGDDVRRVAIAMLVAASVAGAIGLYDDLHGDSGVKGFRGHLRALRSGRVTSGLLKVVVISAAAASAAVMLDRGALGPQQVVDAGVIAGSANLANLLDLRPGRALKAALVVAVPVTFAADAAVGLVAAWPAGVVAGLLPDDVRERTMLGDGGANCVGAAVGVALAAAGGVVVSLVVLALLVGATALSELVSYSALIERSPVLRRLDALGRPQ